MEMPDERMRKVSQNSPSWLMRLRRQRALGVLGVLVTVVGVAKRVIAIWPWTLDVQRVKLEVREHASAWWITLIGLAMILLASLGGLEWAQIKGSLRRFLLLLRSALLNPLPMARGTNVDTLVSERPEQESANDSLGFGETAKRICQIIWTCVPTQSLIVGVEAELGSGKSTLMNFVKERLRDAQTAHPGFLVAELNPWVHDDVRSLLRAVYAAISSSVWGANSPSTARRYSSVLLRYLRAVELSVSAGKYGDTSGISGEFDDAMRTVGA
jgi:hypothetical protein